MKKLYLLLLIIPYLFLNPGIVYGTTDNIGLNVGEGVENKPYPLKTRDGGPDLFPSLGFKWVRTTNVELKSPSKVLYNFHWSCGHVFDDAGNVIPQDQYLKFESDTIKQILANDSIKAVEVGNEPNIDKLGCPVSDFAAQLRRFYAALHPKGIIVISGGVFSKDTPLIPGQSIPEGVVLRTQANGCKVLTSGPKNFFYYDLNGQCEDVSGYLKKLFDYLGGNIPFDAVGVHMYVYENAKNNNGQAVTSNDIRTKYQQYINAIKEASNKPIWVTEYGWRSGDYDGMNETNQAEFMKVSSEWLMGNVDGAFWHAQSDFEQDGGVQRFGIYEINAKNLKPSLYVIKSLNGSLASCNEAKDSDSCTTLAGSTKNGCTWQVCTSAASVCSETSKTKADACRELLVEQAKTDAQTKANTDNQRAGLKLDEEFSVSRCVHMDQYCDAFPECESVKRKIKGAEQNVCLPKEQREELTVLQLGARFFSDNFSNMSIDFCKQKDPAQAISCKYDVLVNCLPKLIETGSFNYQNCAQIYSKSLTKNDILNSGCEKREGDLDNYESIDCRNNFKCAESNAISVADLEICVNLAHQVASNIAVAKSQATPTTASRTTTAPTTTPTINQRAISFCGPTDQICIEAYKGYCDSYTENTEIVQCLKDRTGITPTAVATHIAALPPAVNTPVPPPAIPPPAIPPTAAAPTQTTRSGSGNVGVGTTNPPAAAVQPQAAIAPTAPTCDLACQIKQKIEAKCNQYSDNTQASACIAHLGSPDCNDYGDDLDRCINDGITDFKARWDADHMTVYEQLGGDKFGELVGAYCHEVLGNFLNEGDVAQRCTNNTSSCRNLRSETDPNNPVNLISCIRAGAQRVLDDARRVRTLRRVEITNAWCAAYLEGGTQQADLCVETANRDCGNPYLENEDGFTSCVKQIGQGMQSASAQQGSTQPTDTQPEPSTTNELIEVLLYKATNSGDELLAILYSKDQSGGEIYDSVTVRLDLNSNQETQNTFKLFKKYSSGEPQTEFFYIKRQPTQGSQAGTEAPPASQQSCSPGFRNPSTKECVGECRYTVEVCNDQGNGTNPEEEYNCDFAPDKCKPQAPECVEQDPVDWGEGCAQAKTSCGLGDKFSIGGLSCDQGILAGEDGPSGCCDPNATGEQFGCYDGQSCSGDNGACHSGLICE